MKKLFILLTSFCCIASLFAADFSFIPTPKKFTCKNKLTFSDEKYSLENLIPQFFPEEMVRDHLAERGMTQAAKQPGVLNIKFICDTKDPDLKQKNESYKIVLNKDGFTIKAANTSGAWRAAGRVLAILTAPEVKESGDTISLPEITIFDYPDIAERAMKIEFATTTGKALIDQTKPVIRSVAMFGFNIIFFDVRGNLECKKYPELAKEPVLPQKDVAELIRYAKNCGLEVLPWTNTIGHLGRAPQIFPLYGKSSMSWNNRGKKAPVAMDLTHPDFYKVLFTYFDEVLDLFESPRFFSIGCDEFHDGMKILMEKSGKSFPKLFSDYINDCNKYLGKRKCSPMYAQDMLFPRQKPWYKNGPANGPADALKTLDYIPKDTHIVMWKYNIDAKYPHIGTLQSKGFNNIWAAPWYEPEATAALCKRAYETGCRLLGTTWWYYPQQQGIPTVGEFAWNAANHEVKPTSYYDNLIDHYYFSARKLKKHTKITPAEIVGGAASPKEDTGRFSKISPLFKNPRTFDAPELRIKKLPVITDPQELAKTPRLGITFGDSPIILSRDVIKYNTARGVKELIIYDSKYGKSTRTNPFGAEITVVNNTVTDFTGNVIRRFDIRMSNSLIPENGYVLSYHGKITPVEARRTRNLNISKGDKLNFYQLPDPAIKKTTAKAIICRFSGKKPNARVYVSTLMPVNRNGILSSFRFDTKNRGKSQVFSVRSLLSGGAVSEGNLHFSAVRHNIAETNPVICIEYRAANKNEYPVRAVFSALKEGAISGFTILGAEEFD